MGTFLMSVDIRTKEMLTLHALRASIGREREGETTVVGDLEKLSRALSDDTPEKLAERELQQKAQQIQEALSRDGVYEDASLGVRISARVAAA